jgi:hypothetical protein
VRRCERCCQAAAAAATLQQLLLVQMAPPLLLLLLPVQLQIQQQELLQVLLPHPTQTLLAVQV